ncbi:hypothetical protein RB195_020950 [Necator americanus]
MVALLTTTIPLTIIKYNEKLRAKFLKICSKICNSKEQLEGTNARHFVDLEGTRIKVETRDETAVYFNQFTQAWS